MELFRLAFLSISIIDLLDISLVAYISYKIFLVMRGTRASQMLIGLILLLLISFLVDSFNFSGMKWLLDQLKTVWVIAFVILFQPELRRLLIIAGQSPIARYFVKVEEQKVVGEIVEAAIELSNRGYGGLFVILRDVGLRMIVETGTVLNAKLSGSLLVTIFSPRSPLHDGAVLIRTDLIEAAKCLLPLTQNPHVKLSMGTRHRAALGVTEESDAVVVVISEETSGISIAKEGKMFEDIPHESLKIQLLEALKEKKSS